MVLDQLARDPLRVYALAEVTRMAIKHGVQPPQLAWDDHATLAAKPWLALEGAPAKMRQPYLVLSIKWFDAFVRYPGRALKMLSYVLAHEMRHWLTVAKHWPIPLPRGPKWREKREEWEDQAAYEFAEAETGVTERAFWVWWDAL